MAGERDGLVVLDGEVGNSTYTEDVEAVAPERFVQMYIAEQTMIGAQTGLHALGKIAFAATFGAFLTRAYDQIRMAAIGRADLRLCGSHAGVSIGEDGPSQMALEDLAALRAINGSTVLYPADGTATVSLVTAMADLHGISYVRTTREATAVLYGPDEDFPIGGSKTLGEGDDVAIVGAGITVHESLRAADQPGGRRHRGPDHRLLQRQTDRCGGAPAAPRPRPGCSSWSRTTGSRGASATRCSARSPSGVPSTARVIKLAVTEMPGSGAPEELRAWAGIDADAIVRAVRTRARSELTAAR